MLYESHSKRLRCTRGSVDFQDKQQTIFEPKKIVAYNRIIGNKFVTRPRVPGLNSRFHYPVEFVKNIDQLKN